LQDLMQEPDSDYINGILQYYLKQELPETVFKIERPCFATQVI